MKTLLAYIVILVTFGLGIHLTLKAGRQLERNRPVSVATTPSGNEAQAPATAATQPTTPDATKPEQTSSPLSILQGNARDPLSRLFFQLILIMLATRLVGTIFGRIGLQVVVGEMVAGILLGPSLFGWLVPDAFQFIFQPQSLGTLKLLSQIGVCLFMFVVGMELEVVHLRHQARTAVVVSHASIIIPYFLGVVAALGLFSRFAPPNISFLSFALFMGISMSITAFPVLARILAERRMSKTFLGSTAIACAAIDDVTAWIILAFVVVVIRAGAVESTALTLALVGVFVAVMLLFVKPRLPRWFSLPTEESGVPSHGILAGVLIFTLASALTTELIGIHALFGAFLAGVVMPRRGGIREALTLRLENFSSVFLLPLFFAFTGLRTQFGLLDTWEDWLICLGIIGLATLGKLGGSMLTARWTGLNWRDSFRLGALMNTRGLMELIALNLGFDLGILSPVIFTMLVIMAVTTTLLTGPLLSLADATERRSVRLAKAVAKAT